MDTSNPSPLLLEQTGPVVRLTLNRPERRNALGRGLIQSLCAALDAIAGNRTARVVVLASAGKVFCSGHDLSEMVGREEAEYHGLFADCAEMMLRIRKLPQPVIARGPGLATAAGCQLVATCDLVVAADTAQFAAPGVKIGLFCTTPMVPLVRAIPAKLAMEMLLTAEPLSAERALAAGLVNRVVPVDELDTAVDAYAQAIARSSPHVIALGKKAFYRQLPLDEATAYGEAVEIITGNVRHPDAQEGIVAFLEKRAPRWHES
ncbi:MAG: enoyl-CoA hydratase [Planctomycetota bacterium]|nr:enoyl-CoA hydratase [Planctomycetota bacterium]